MLAAPHYFSKHVTFLQCTWSSPFPSCSAAHLFSKSPTNFKAIYTQGHHSHCWNLGSVCLTKRERENDSQRWRRWKTRPRNNGLLLLPMPSSHLTPPLAQSRPLFSSSSSLDQEEVSVKERERDAYTHTHPVQQLQIFTALSRTTHW